MKIVFIGGSRNVRDLDAEIRRRLDRIMAQRLSVAIGDAGGADKSVQDYLHRHAYRSVEVFCMDGRCRHNVGNWPLRAVPSPHNRKDFSYYATKDRLMAETATMGFMIWDGQSAGTLANVARLVRQGKAVLIYMVENRRAVRLTQEPEWEKFLEGCPATVRARLEEKLREESEPAAPTEASLF